MKKFILILFVFVGLVNNSLFSQDATTRKEFNGLLNGLRKTEGGSIKIYDDLTEKIITCSERSKNWGFYAGDITKKNFKYIGENKFECYTKIRGIENDVQFVEWIKSRIAVYDNYLIIEYPEKSTKLNKFIESEKQYLVEKKTVYLPEFSLELTSTSNIVKSNSKVYINYTLKNIGKGRC